MQRISLDLEEGSWSREHTPSILSKSIFYYLQSAGHFCCGCAYATNRVKYDTMLLIHTISGRGILKYRSHDYELSTGSILLIDCMEEQHYSSGVETPWIFDFIHFHGSESRGYVGRILSSGGPVYILEDNSIIPDRIASLHTLLRGNQEKMDILASCLLVEILTELLLLSSRSSSGTGSTPATIQEAIAIIEQEYSSSLSLGEIALRLSVSKFHLSRIFKLYTGYSPYEYLIKCRLNHAKTLLKTSHLPVHEIACQTGFDSTSHFIKMFGRHEGVTPLKFRKFWR